MAKFEGKRIVDESGNTLGIVANPLVTNATATITGDVNVDSTSIDTNGLIGKNSGGDFTITYASATSLTLGTYPDGTSVAADDIVTVQHTTAAGAVVATYSRDDKTMSMAGNVLTVVTAVFGATDSFVVYTNIPRFIGGVGVVTSQVQRVTLATDISLPAGTNALGGIELKDGVTTNRAVINAANTARAATDKVLLVQTIDATGAVGSGLSGAAVLADAEANPTISSLGAKLAGFNGTTWDRIRTGITGVVTSVLGYINVMNVGRYNATALTLADTNYVNAQVDVNGSQQVNQRTLQAGEDLSNNVMVIADRKLASPTYSPLLFTNFGANTTLNVKASLGNVFALSCTNTNAAARYIQLHNTATVPAPGAVALWTHLVPAGSEVIIGEDFFSQMGLYFTTGIAFATSITKGTYTAATAGEHFVEVHYI